MNRREFLEESKKGTITVAAGLAGLHGVETARAAEQRQVPADRNEGAIEEGPAVPKYRSLVGYPQGARRLHIHLTEFKTDRGVNKDQHTHEAEEAMYILEGKAEFTFDGKTHRVGPGDTVFFPSGVRHAERKYLTDTMRYLVIRTVEPEDEPCCCGEDRRREDA
ncbi:MAG TPA: hypothetical protein DD670_08110 [Planctomycetaceae bacterium]|nr:hypothetical protein [Planctomycetaceae bacterium]